MRFVIIASRRTGSTHLATTLSGHPDIFCNGNIFKPSTLQLFWPKSDLTDNLRKEMIELRRADPASFMERVFESGYGRRHVGFKIFAAQNDSILMRVINDSSVRKIVLIRTNVLANYASTLAARNTGRYAQREGDERAGSQKVAFSEQDFVEFASTYLKYYGFVLSALVRVRQDFCLLRYEEINDSQIVRQAINFIGADSSVEIEKHAQYKQLAKQNPTDILSRFEDGDRVEAFLRKRSLLHWAHEGTSVFATP